MRTFHLPEALFEVKIIPTERKTILKKRKSLKMASLVLLALHCLYTEYSGDIFVVSIVLERLQAHSQGSRLAIQVQSQGSRLVLQVQSQGSQLV